MKIIKPSYEIEEFDAERILRSIEKAGKTCYKSEHTITEDIQSAKEFVKMIISRGHESVLEHEKLTIRIICDRGVTHEIVRHRIASYSQESTRYCNYAKRNQIEVIDIGPELLKNGAEGAMAVDLWKDAMYNCEKAYINMVDVLGIPPQLARSVLPNSLKTEIVITMNLREWRYFLRLRTRKNAHPQMREITIPLLWELKEKLPEIFADIIPEE